MLTRIGTTPSHCMLRMLCDHRTALAASQAQSELFEVLKAFTHHSRTMGICRGCVTLVLAVLAGAALNVLALECTLDSPWRSKPKAAAGGVLLHGEPEPRHFTVSAPRRD